MSASETIFRITGGFRNNLLESQAAYLKAGTSFLKRVTGRMDFVREPPVPIPIPTV
jgi:hypothetical protein